MSRLAALALVAALATGCGVPVDEEPTALDPSAAPFQAYLPRTAPEPQGGRDVAFYLVRGDRLERSSRSIEGDITPRAVLEQLLEGITPQQEEAGLTSAIPATVRLRDIRLEDDTAVVTLEGFPEQTRGDEPLAYAQIVTTLDALPGIEGVRFRAGGKDLAVPGANGVLTDSPLDRNDYAQQLARPSPSATPSPTAELDLPDEPPPSPAS